MQFSSVQLLSPVQLFATPWIAARQASLSITNSQSSPKPMPMSIESVMPSSHLIFCCPLLLLLSIFPSIRVFSNESIIHMRWPKYWSFSFSISPSNEHPGLVSFSMDWLDLLAVQGTQVSSPKPQFKSINSSALSFLSFFFFTFTFYFILFYLWYYTCFNAILPNHPPSAFFIVQLSHPYMTTGKIIALTR